MSLDKFSSPNLFSSLLDTTIQPNSVLLPVLLPPLPQTLRDSLDDDDDIVHFDRTAFKTADLFPSASPVLTSTPRPGPLTQEVVDRMLELRRVDDDEDVVAAYRRENEELKSEVAALRLEREDLEKELTRVRQLLSKSSAQQQPPPPPEFADGYQVEAAHVAAEATLPPGCVSIQHLPPPPPSSTDTTLPPGSMSIQLPPPGSPPHPTGCPPPPTGCPPPPSQPLPTIHVFHDSNLKSVTADEILNSLKIINGQTNTTTNHNITPHETFTLPQTLNAIKRITFKPNDSVILNILTNDARQTKHRQERSPQQTKNTQTAIINYLKAFIPLHHIVILESPPLLNTPTSDIFPFNLNSYLLSRQLGTRFSETLIGEGHLFKDGYHVLRSARHLLVKSVAAAIANVRPHQRLKLLRPPHGNYGPWAAPLGVGMLPSTYQSAAVARPSAPINFRRAGIQPLMDINIRQPRNFKRR